MPTAIRIIYSVAVGVFVVLTVAFGTLTFAPGPERPEFPAELRFAEPRPLPEERPLTPAQARPPADEDAAATAARQAYDDDIEQYREDRRTHRRRVLAAAAVLGGVLVVAGIAVAGAIDVMRIGLMLGGLFTVLWAFAYAGGDAGSGTMFVAALAVLTVLAGLSHPALRGRLRGALRLGASDDLLSG